MCKCCSQLAKQTGQGRGCAQLLCTPEQPCFLQQALELHQGQEHGEHAGGEVGQQEGRHVEVCAPLLVGDQQLAHKAGGNPVSHVGQQGAGKGQGRRLRWGVRSSGPHAASRVLHQLAVTMQQALSPLPGPQESCAATCWQGAAAYQMIAVRKMSTRPRARPDSAGRWTDKAMVDLCLHAAECLWKYTGTHDVAEVCGQTKRTPTDDVVLCCPAVAGYCRCCISRGQGRTNNRSKIVIDSWLLSNCPSVAQRRAMGIATEIFSTAVQNKQPSNPTVRPSKFQLRVDAF